MFVSDGNIFEYLGTNRTSSNVSASFISSILTYKQFYKFIKSLMRHSVYKFP